jgi:hypothetical protein
MLNELSGNGDRVFRGLADGLVERFVIGLDLTVVNSRSVTCLS